MFKVFVKYPSFNEEFEIARRTTALITEEITPVLSRRADPGAAAAGARVPVTDHVIHYTLALVRQTRVGEPGVPKFIRDWLSWGAGPRAVQYLILGGKARALLYGRVARPDRGHPGAGLPGAAAPHPDQLHRRVRRHHDRHGHQEAARGDAEQGGRADHATSGSRRSSRRDAVAAAELAVSASTRSARCAAGAPRSRLIANRTESATRGQPTRRRPAPLPAPRRPSPASRRLDLRARQVVEGFISGMHRSPFFGHSRRVRAAPRVHPRRRHPPPRLEGLVQDRPLLHQAVRGRDQPALHPGRRRQRVDALRPRAAEQVRLRLHRRRLPRLPAAAPAGLGRPASPSTTTCARSCPPRSQQTHIDAIVQGDARQPAAREDRHREDPAPRHREHRRPRHDRPHLRPARRPRAALPRPGNAAPPPARRPRLPRPGRRRADLPVRRHDALRGHGRAAATCCATRAPCATATSRRWRSTWSRSAAAAPGWASTTRWSAPATTSTRCCRSSCTTAWRRSTIGAQADSASDLTTTMLESVPQSRARWSPGGALVSSPIIIHLINRMRFKRIRWAAMEFLLKSQKRNRRRLIIEQLILLLLRILLVLLAGLLVARFVGVALAFIRPQSTLHVVVLDDTPSMGDAWRAEGVAKNTFDVAKAADRGRDRPRGGPGPHAAGASARPAVRARRPVPGRTAQRGLGRRVAEPPRRPEADGAARRPGRRRPQGQGTLRAEPDGPARAARRQRFPRPRLDRRRRPKRCSRRSPAHAGEGPGRGRRSTCSTWPTRPAARPSGRQSTTATPASSTSSRKPASPPGTCRSISPSRSANYTPAERKNVRVTVKVNGQVREDASGTIVSVPPGITQKDVHRPDVRAARLQPGDRQPGSRGRRPGDRQHPLRRHRGPRESAAPVRRRRPGRAAARSPKRPIRSTSASCSSTPPAGSTSSNAACRNWSSRTSSSTRPSTCSTSRG